MKLVNFFWSNELYKYFIASLLSLALDLGLFSFSLRILQLTWMQSASIGFLCGVISAYLFSIYFVFSTRSIQKRPLVEFVIFSLIGILGLVVTQISLYIGIELLRILPEIAKLIAAGITFITNFFLRKIILFNKL